MQTINGFSVSIETIQNMTGSEILKMMDEIKKFGGEEDDRHEK